MNVRLTRGLIAISIALVPAAALLVPRTGSAQSAPDEALVRTTPDPAPLAITVSGDGTKGAYMAGHLFYRSRLTSLPDQFEPAVLTGASAGAINSVIGALSACGPEVQAPTESLFWEAWASVGIHSAFRSRRLARGC
ncbi:MAG: putative acylesterase/phospholipase RssA [Bradymonadia bacterium]|jgi:predicted acylesterase/phospholipase RssA